MIKNPLVIEHELKIADGSSRRMVIHQMYCNMNEEGE